MRDEIDDKVAEDMNRKDGIYPNAYDDMATFNCKIDSHIPTKDGQNCECGYFTKAKNKEG